MMNAVPVGGAATLSLAGSQRDAAWKRVPGSAHLPLSGRPSLSGSFRVFGALKGSFESNGKFKLTRHTNVGVSVSVRLLASNQRMFTSSRAQLAQLYSLLRLPPERASPASERPMAADGGAPLGYAYTLKVQFKKVH